MGDLELEEDESVGGGVGVGGGALRALDALVEEGVIGVGLAHEGALLDELGEHLRRGGHFISHSLDEVGLDLIFYVPSSRLAAMPILLKSKQGCAAYSGM